MSLSQSPRLMQIDPFLIKFNAANPRKHHGLELLRLKKSIEKVGRVQFPTVRDLYAEFVECLDGEGRVLVAQENHEPQIWVVNLGKVHDSEALLMLQAANTVRTFGFLDECRGLANLHRQGETTRSLADKFNMGHTKTSEMVAIGYFPDELLTLIHDDIAQSEEHAQLWTHKMLVTLLPLRQELPGKDPSQAWQHEETLDDVYEYTEVRRAIEKVLNGEITDVVHMHEYVAQRRFDLFKARFDQVLQKQVKAELEQAKLALEENHTQSLEHVKQETAKEYEAKLQRLQEERDNLDRSYQIAINNVAKQSEKVKQAQFTLQQKVNEVEQKRQDVEVLQRKLEAEASAQEKQLRAKEQQLQEEKQRQLEEELMRQQARGHEEYVHMKEELASHYARMERELELETETNIHQIVADCTRLLTETQLSVLNLISPDVFKGVVWLQRPEMMALVAQLRTVRETFEQAEEQILHGNVVFDTERGASDGFQTYH